MTTNYFFKITLTFELWLDYKLFFQNNFDSRFMKWLRIIFFKNNFDFWKVNHMGGLKVINTRRSLMTFNPPRTWHVRHWVASEIFLFLKLFFVFGKTFPVYLQAVDRQTLFWNIFLFLEKHFQSIYKPWIDWRAWGGSLTGMGGFVGHPPPPPIFDAAQTFFIKGGKSRTLCPGHGEGV